MKKIIRFSILTLLAIIMCVMPKVIKAQENKEVEVVFTHDLHSHLEGFMTEYNDETVEMGGFARIKTVLDQKRKENENLLVLDGGDFSMGTLYQTIFEEQASEYRMLGYLGFDATTLGNHEFDYRAAGLISMMENAKKSEETLPAMVVCNAKLEGSEFEDLDIKPYIMVSKGNVNIAILGVFGEDALKCAPTCTMVFEDPVESVKKTVEEIIKTENPDLIVCLSHSGTSSDPDKSEDERLAKEVPELDLIISGHTHTLLEEPIVVGDTYIASTGEYGSRIGNVHMVQKEDGRWKLESYDLIPMTNEVEEDVKTKDIIADYRKQIDSLYLQKFGYTMDQVLTFNPWEFTGVSEIGKTLTEEPLGSVISDSYIDAVKKAEGENYIPVDMAVVPSGVIRDTFATGDVTVADVFSISSLGVGPDGVPGYPLISIYLTGKELKTTAEIDASISPIMSTAELYCSGLNYSINTNRMILNKITDVYLTDENGNRIEIEDDKLYRVVADLYSGQMLSAVNDMSYGILSLVPKDKDGNPIDDFEKHIIYDGEKELKAWAAIAGYVDSFDTMPEYYSTTQGRKVVSDSKNLISILKNPNKITLAIYAVALILLIAIVLIVRLIIKHSKKKKQNLE